MSLRSIVNSSAIPPCTQLFHPHSRMMRLCSQPKRRAKQCISVNHRFVFPSGDTNVMTQPYPRLPQQQSRHLMQTRSNQSSMESFQPFPHRTPRRKPASRAWFMTPSDTALTWSNTLCMPISQANPNLIKLHHLFKPPNPPIFAAFSAHACVLSAYYPKTTKMKHRSQPKFRGFFSKINTRVPAPMYDRDDIPDHGPADGDKDDKQPSPSKGSTAGHLHINRFPTIVVRQDTPTHTTPRLVVVVWGGGSISLWVQTRTLQPHNSADRA